MEANGSRAMKLLKAVGIFAILGCLILIFSSLLTARQTGLLSVKTSDPQAEISVDQDNKSIAKIGTGSAKVRLKPGTYHLQAKAGSRLASATIKIQQSETTNSFLELKDYNGTPSVEDVSFENTNALIDSGVSEEQITVLEQAFFTYTPSAKKILIDPASIQPGAHNRFSEDPFTINFNVSIDGVPRLATISYTDLDNIRLYLYDTAKVLLFDSWANESGNE